MDADMINNLLKYQQEIKELTTNINNLPKAELKEEEKIVKKRESSIKISTNVYVSISVVIIIVSIILLIYNRPFFVTKETDIHGTRVLKNYELDYTKLTVVVCLEIILLFYIFNVL
jgi:hypothetical protein